MSDGFIQGFDLRRLRTELSLAESATDEDARREHIREAALTAEKLGNGSPRSSKQTRLLSPTELAELPQPHYLIGDLLRAEALNVLYGPSGVGKSLLALDLSLCTASGLTWYGQPVERGAVVFVAGEGTSGISARIESWQRARGIKTVTGFRVYPEAVNLYRGEVEQLTTAIDQLEIAPSLIIFDTVARCMVGGDENSARDVGLVVEQADYFRDRYGAAVLLVHHTGKSGDLERGSSALRGAADTIISLKKNNGSGIRLRCEKQKDGPAFESWNLHLKPAGDSVSIGLGTAEGHVSSQEVEILEVVSAESGTEWVPATTIIDVSEAGRSSVYRLLKALSDAGFLEVRVVGGNRKEYRITFKGLSVVPERPRASHGTASVRPIPPLSLEGGTGEEVEG